MHRAVAYKLCLLAMRPKEACCWGLLLGNVAGGLNTGAGKRNGETVTGGLGLGNLY